MKHFPDRERRSHVDIYPGMMFCFAWPWRRDALHLHCNWWSELPLRLDKTIPWIVINKECVDDSSMCYWRYLLLGPNNIVKWHRGDLGWIKRIADPCQRP